MKRYKMFVIVLLILMLAGCGRTGNSVSAPAPAGVGAQVENFTLRDLQGNTVSLSDSLKEKPVMLVFFATWCPSCNAEIPRLNRLHETEKNLRIIAVDVNESDQAVASFAQSRGIRYTVLLDSDGSVARKWGIVGIPTNFVIDRSGTVVFKDYVIPEDLASLLPRREKSGD
jgi:peroxiredoxin